MVNRSKAKGTAAETAIVNCLTEERIPARRKAMSGALDRGDIEIFDNLITVEVKNEKRMALSEYVEEAEKEYRNAGSWLGVVWHKRRGKSHPKDWYVTMSGEMFLKILREEKERLGL
jgi:hypothetical protein